MKMHNGGLFDLGNSNMQNAGLFYSKEIKNTQCKLVMRVGGWMYNWVDQLKTSHKILLDPSNF